MTEHLPECPIRKPCCDDVEFPEHGFCGNYAGRCLHCMAECICDALRACETRVGAAFHKVRADDRKQWGLVAEEQFDAGFTEAITQAMRRIKALPAVVIPNHVGITPAHVIAALKDL